MTIDTEGVPAPTGAPPDPGDLAVSTPVVSVVVGIAYLLPFENILAGIVPTIARWLPGQLLDSVAHGGDSTAGFGTGLWTLAVYLAAASLVAAALFERRDVTA